MRRSDNLYAQHTFGDVDPFYMGTTFQAIIDKDNGDGTYEGHYDLDNMSTVKKILAMLE